MASSASLDAIEETAVQKLVSPVPDLLSDSSSIPTLEQQHLIDQHVISVSDSLSRLDEQIPRLEKLRTELNASQNIHRALSSRIRHLPSEVLSEIFCFYHWMISKQYSLEISWKRMTAALPVSHVCRTWRNVALGCVYLWSRIDYRTYHKGRVELVKEFIRRSKGYPLNIIMVLQMAEEGEEALADEGWRVLNMIGAERHRWSKLSVSVKSAPLPMVCDYLFNRSPLPMLQLFRFFVPPSYGSFMAPPHLPYFDDATKLRTLELSGMTYPALFTDSPLPLQLEHINSNDVRFILRALQKCPNLISASRFFEEDRITRSEDINVEFPDPIENGSLQSLRITHGHCRNEVLRKLTLPALETLTLQDYEYTEKELLQILPTFLSHSNHLRSLTMEVHFDAEDLEIFRAILVNNLPELIELRVKDFNPPLALLSAGKSPLSCLHATPTEQPVPSLRMLEYHLCIEDWMLYTPNEPRSHAAMFCMIYLTSLEALTEEILTSRANMRNLERLALYINKVTDFERTPNFFHELDGRWKDQGLDLLVHVGRKEEIDDPILDAKWYTMVSSLA